MNKIVTALLQLNGWVAVLIGSFIVLDPVTLLQPYGLQSELSAGLLSELRAPGGLLIGCGLLIVRCSIAAELHQLGLMASAMVYGGYGSVRLLGFLVDGQPPTEILIAFAIEVVLFAAALFTIVSVKRGSRSTILNQLKV